MKTKGRPSSLPQKFKMAEPPDNGILFDIYQLIKKSSRKKYRDLNEAVEYVIRNYQSPRGASVDGRYVRKHLKMLLDKQHIEPA